MNKATSTKGNYEASGNVPQPKLWHPVRLTPHPPHSLRLYPPLERKRGGHGEEEDRFKRRDQRGEACKVMEKSK